MITSPSQAIDLLGGGSGPKAVRAVADHIGRPFTTVASWATRQSIPVDVWPQLIEMAADKGTEGFTYEALVQAHAKVKADKTPPTPATPTQTSEAA